MSNSFKLCPTHFSTGEKNFPRGASPPTAPTPNYGPDYVSGRPEPTKERVERTTLGITAKEIPIQLGPLFYRPAATNSSLGHMWHNHVATPLPHSASSRRRPSTVDCSHRHDGTHFFAAITLRRRTDDPQHNSN